MAAVTISAKGSIVIPKDIRERHGLKKGDKVRFIESGGLISIIPAVEDPLTALRGRLKGGPSLTEALLEERRSDREREEEKARRWT